MLHQPTRLTVAIGPDLYDLAVDELEEFTYRLRKYGEGEAYKVRLAPGRAVLCTCPDFEHRRRGTIDLCKHGRALVELRLIRPDPIRP